MAATPKYVTEFREVTEKLKRDQEALRKSQDNMMIAQGDILKNQNNLAKQISTIYDALIGNELIKDLDGGLVKRVSDMSSDLDSIKQWKHKMSIIYSIAYAAIVGAIGFLGTVIVKNWDKIFR